MKLSEIEEGMTLMWGTQRQLADARNATKVLVSSSLELVETG